MENKTVLDYQPFELKQSEKELWFHGKPQLVYMKTIQCTKTIQKILKLHKVLH